MTKLAFCAKLPLFSNPLTISTCLINHALALNRQSYDVDIDVSVVGEGVKFTGSYDLKNPNFRYMTMPPPPPGSHHANPTETYFEPNTTNSNPYAQGGTLQQATALIPQSPQIMSPASAGGTVVVSAMTPHPVMAVHAAPPGINGVTVMNGGLLGGPAGHAHNASSKTSSGSGPLHGIHAHAQPPLLQSPPPGPAHHFQSVSPHGHGGGGGMLQPVSGASPHQTQYVYASAATAVGTMGSPQFVYKFHQVHPGAGRTHSTY